MSIRLWRLLLLALCACCVVLNAVSLFSDNVEASSALGFQVTRTSDNAFARVSSIDPGGAAAASGLRVGDLIHLRELSPGNRYRLLTGVYPHEKLSVVVSRGSRTIALRYESGNAPAWRWDTWLYCMASFWLLGFAMLLAWKRPDSGEARLLCVLLALSPAGAALMAGSWMSSSPLADIVTACVGYTINEISTALLVTYAALFVRPISVARRIMSGLAYAAAAAIAAYEVIRLVLLWTGAEPWVAQTLGPDWNFGWAAAPQILALICAWMAASYARGTERSRISWSVVTLSALYVFGALSFVVPLLLPDTARGTALVVAYSCVNVGSFLAPLGMTYALLNHRLLDVGFALNRVAVFTTVSLVLVGVFVLAEWAFTQWFSAASHTTNLAVSALLALALGLSVRFVHARVDRVLDAIFFRKRHEDEEAIRALARDAAYITDPDVLLSRATAALQAHADASGVAFLLHDGAEQYGDVSENDAAIVRLRATHKPLDLRDIETAIHGEFAYPMLARGRLVGALVLGLKRSGEAYAPDESDAIAQLAHDVGTALDVLAMREGSGRDAMLEEIHRSTRAIYEAIQALPAALRAERLP